MRRSSEEVLFNSKTVISQLLEVLTHLKEVIFRFKAKGSASNLSSEDKHVKTQRTWSLDGFWCCAARRNVLLFFSLIREKSSGMQTDVAKTYESMSGNNKKKKCSVLESRFYWSDGKTTFSVE